MAMSANTAPEATVYVVEDDAAVRESLLLLLTLKGFDARGFESAESFLDSVRPDRPGCVVLDLRMPGKNGLEVQALLKEQCIELPVVIVTAYGDVSAARTAFKAGAVDFLEKPVDEAVLFAAIMAALARDRHRRDVYGAAAAIQARLARLSAREREVMWLVADGHQNRDIGAMLGVSPRTIEIYKARMLEKLQVRGLPDLLRVLSDIPRDRRDAG
jgi:two-component system, LuxR family, response regulator FixJ